MERNAIFIERQDVTGADYSRQTFDKFGTLGATLTGCRFDRAYLKHCAFGSGTEQSHFVDCSFDGSYLRALGGFTRFVGCTFRNLRVTQTSPDYLEFVDCTFTGQITGLRLWGAPLSPVDRYMSLTTSLARQGRPEPPHLEQLMVRDRNEVRGNDFSTARLIKVEFRFGVDLTAQRLPAGDEYVHVRDPATAVPRAVAALAEHPSEHAARARDFLTRLDDRAGQQQLFLCPRDFEGRRGMPPHLTLAFAELARVTRATGSV